MKSIKYFLISIVAILSYNECYACWGGWYEPSSYYMYRVSNQTLKDDLENEELYPGSKKNCEEWQLITSNTIPLDDIYYVVYEMSLEDYENIYNNKPESNNQFVEWITQKDTTILDFLLLAKTNEYIRLKRNSRWYYPTMKTGARMTLEEVAEKALSNTNVKLRDRYLLQGIRALFTLAKYEECISIWETEASALPEENLMRQLIQPYIAGAEFRLNHSEKAMQYFIEAGDIESMLYCSGISRDSISTVDAIELVCKYDPNNKYIEKALQTYIRGLEPAFNFYQEDEFKMTSQEEKLYSLCIKMAKDSRSKNPAMWYYTAAFLLDLNNQATEASNLLSLAEKSRSTKYIDESIKVFRIYLDAKTETYNSSYENKLFTQIKWLDSMICNNINEEVINVTANGYMLKGHQSYYYWNDVMQKILISEVCPEMIKAGKTTRALQLANMADNRLLGLINKQDYSDWVETDDEWKRITIRYSDMADYRYSGNHNMFDYSNSFFEIIDSIGLNAAMKYVDNVRNPKTDFDRFLNSRGYTGNDYLYDIIGTQCLRNMRYADAVKYLGMVSETYKNHLNVYMEYDPFSFTRKRITNDGDFRYDFAVKMNSLEQTINVTSNPDRKARLILKYAIGLQNSFDICWGLTQYYKGISYYGQVCEKRDWENGTYSKAAKAKAQELISSAFTMVTDSNVAADLHYELCHYTTIAKEYPETQKGLYIKGHCDNLRDYFNTKTHSEIRW